MDARDDDAFASCCAEEEADSCRCKPTLGRDGDEFEYNKARRRSSTRAAGAICSAKGDFELTADDSRPFAGDMPSNCKDEDFFGVDALSSCKRWCLRFSGRVNLISIAPNTLMTLRSAPGPLTAQRFDGGASNTTLQMWLRPRIAETM